MSKLVFYREILDKKLAQREVYRDEIKKRQLEIKYAERKVDDFEEARKIVAIVAKATQVQFKEYVENLVTLALQAVFPEKDYKFIIKFDLKNNKSVAHLLVQQGGDDEPFEPKEENAGSMINVIGFSLRIVLWSLQTPRSRATIILDEPFPATGKLAPIVGEFLKEISHHPRLRLQIIMITHEDELAEVADRAWRVEREGNESKLIPLNDQKVIIKRRNREPIARSQGQEANSKISQNRRIFVPR